MRIISSIIVLVVLGVATWVLHGHYDRPEGYRDSFLARFLTTFLGVCIAATLSYSLWTLQQWHGRSELRRTVAKNLRSEIEDNRATLHHLAEYLGRLEKWARALDTSATISKEFMRSDDPERGEHLKEILPYRQVSFVASDAISKGSLTLLPSRLQEKIRRLAAGYEELNHRIDYCEKSSLDFVYTMTLAKPSEEARKSLIVYQARSVIGFLKRPTEDMIRLCEESLSLLDGRGITEGQVQRTQEPNRPLRHR